MKGRKQARLTFLGIISVLDGGQRSPHQLDPLKAMKQVIAAAIYLMTKD